MFSRISTDVACSKSRPAVGPLCVRLSKKRSSSVSNFGAPRGPCQSSGRTVCQSVKVSKCQSVKFRPAPGPLLTRSSRSRRRRRALCDTRRRSPPRHRGSGAGRGGDGAGARRRRRCLSVYRSRYQEPRLKCTAVRAVCVRTVSPRVAGTSTAATPALTPSAPARPLPVDVIDTIRLAYSCTRSASGGSPMNTRSSALPTLCATVELEG